MIPDLNRYLPAVLGLLIAALSGPAFSDISNETKADRIYDVELILFRNEAVPRGQETVLPTPSPALPENSIDFNNPKSAANALKQGFQPLAESELRLKAERERLDKSRRYRVLEHFGWRQPGLAASDARAIRIRGGRFYDGSYASIDETLSNSPEADAETPMATGLAVGSRRGLFELEGWVRVSLSRYLHTEANLVLREPANEEQRQQSRRDLQNPVLDDLQQKLLVNYPLKEKRRMRSKRLHYLDHPEYGVLVLITPYQPTPPKAEAATSEATVREQKTQ